jgi:PAS domain S-box-containing protein
MRGAGLDMFENLQFAPPQCQFTETQWRQLDALIQLAGEQIRETFNADIAYIALLDRAANTINFPYNFGEDFTSFPFGEGLTSKIIESGQPLLINRDIAARRAELGATQVGTAAQSYLGVPIFVGGNALGVVSVQSTQHEGRFDENNQRLLATIAANVGVAIERAQLYKEMQRQKQYFESVVQTSPVAIALSDLDQRVASWNPAAEKLFGYSQAEAIGRDLDDLVANRAELQRQAREFTPKNYRGETFHAITQRTRKDGSLVDVELYGEIVHVSVGGIGLFHDTYRPLLFPTIEGPSFYCYRCDFGKEPASCAPECLASLEEIMRRNRSRVAALIIEPVVQAAGNVKDGSNQRVVAFDYGLPTANQVLGFTVAMKDVVGFDGAGS